MTIKIQILGITGCSKMLIIQYNHHHTICSFQILDLCKKLLNQESNQSHLKTNPMENGHCK